MSSLNHILNIGNESLQNSKVAVDVTGHNISNAHTPGYSRQSANIGPNVPAPYGRHILGQGARVDSIVRTHDKFLEGQVREHLQHQGFANQRAHGLEKLETMFNPELTGTIRQRMGYFQNALRDLANHPEDVGMRVHVVETAQGLCETFQAVHRSISDVQSSANEEIFFEVNMVNKNLKNLADINQRIKELELQGGMANDLLDKRDALLRDLSESLDIRTYNDSSGSLVIRGPGDTLLLEGNHTAQLHWDKEATGQPRLGVTNFLGKPFKDITESIHQGKLGGLLWSRDKNAQSLKNELNHFASRVVDDFNGIHSQAYGTGDYATVNGRAFFTLDSGDAAENMSVHSAIRSDPALFGTAFIAGSVGDNSAVNAYIHLMENKQAKYGEMSWFDAYDRIVNDLGVQSQKAMADRDSSQISLSQIQSQKESVSGVSLDEEASHLLKFQHLFAASSKIISTVDEMFQTILNLKH